MARRSVIRERPTIQDPRVARLASCLIFGWCVLSASAFGQAPVLVKDIILGTGSSAPLNLTAVGNKVFFTPADDGSGSYRNLWVSDGTENGTNRVKWFADDGTNDIEPWITNGTYAEMIENISLIGGSVPSGGVDFRGFLYFAAQSDDHGNELWMLPLAIFKDGFESGNTSAW